MKRFAKMISLITAAVMLLGIAALPAAAESGSCGENLTWTFENGVLTVSGEGEMTDYPATSPENIPPWIDLPVTSIVVEEGVTYLGVNAFSLFVGDDPVVSISLPASLAGIGRGALCGSPGVISVDEGNEVFKTVGDCLIESGSHIVLGCDTSVIPADGSIRSIGYRAFSNCGGLTELELPEGIVTIGDGAFANCKNLVSVTLPKGLKRIGREAFANCCSLRNINLPDGLESIMYCAFSGCDSLEGVTVPASVKADSDYPFGVSTGTTLKVYALSFAHRIAEYLNYSFEIIGTIGDFDGDGEITVSDALTVLRIAARLVEPDENALVTGDLDFDCMITVNDALMLLRVAVGLD